MDLYEIIGSIIDVCERMETQIFIIGVVVTVMFVAFIVIIISQQRKITALAARQKKELEIIEGVIAWQKKESEIVKEESEIVRDVIVLQKEELKIADIIKELILVLQKKEGDETYSKNIALLKEWKQKVTSEEHKRRIDNLKDSGPFGASLVLRYLNDSLNTSLMKENIQ